MGRMKGERQASRRSRASLAIHRGRARLPGRVNHRCAAVATEPARSPTAWPTARDEMRAARGARTCAFCRRRRSCPRPARVACAREPKTSARRAPGGRPTRTARNAMRTVRYLVWPARTGTSNVADQAAARDPFRCRWQALRNGQCTTSTRCRPRRSGSTIYVSEPAPPCRAATEMSCSLLAERRRRARGSEATPAVPGPPARQMSPSLWDARRGHKQGVEPETSLCGTQARLGPTSEAEPQLCCVCSMLYSRQPGRAAGARAAGGIGDLGSGPSP